MWFHPTDADHQRIFRSGKLYVTNDQWASINAPDVISPVPLMFSPFAGDGEDRMMVGLTITGGTPPVQPHIIGTLFGEDDVTASGIAGSSPGTSPYTDSIPYTCGGLAVGGIQAIL